MLFCPQKSMSLRFGNGAKQWPVGWINKVLQKFHCEPTPWNRWFFIFTTIRQLLRSYVPYLQRISSKGLAYEGFMRKTRRGKKWEGLCSDPVWVPDRHSAVRGEFGSRQAFPRRRFSINASADEGFFACFFAPKKACRSVSGTERNSGRWAG